MVELSKNRKYKRYKWVENKGYGTKKHIKALKGYGTSRYHRKLFIRKIIKIPN